VNNARENGQAQAVPIGAAPGRAGDLTGPGLMSDTHLWIPPGSEVPPAARDDAPRGRRRWLTKRLIRGLAGVLAILLVGAAVRYWRANTGFVKTDNAQTYGDLAPISPRVGGTVLRVRVEEHDPYQNGFLAHGTDPFTAHQRAFAVLQGLVYQQAVVVAYAYDFALLGVLFVACLPLLILIRRARSKPESHVAEI
jgi:hypothetical protein